MPVLTVGNTDIPYTLRRSELATRARITVTPDLVEVVVPTATTEDEIAGVLHRRRAWLFEQTRRMAAVVAASPAIGRFASGAKIPYRGRLMRLKSSRPTPLWSRLLSVTASSLDTLDLRQNSPATR